MRIVLDSRLSIPPGSKIFAPGTTVFVSDEAPGERRAAAAAAGMDVVTVPLGPLGLSISDILSALGSRGINSLLVEGGPSVIASFFREGLVDGVALFLSPRIMGRNRCFSGPLAFTSMDETVRIAGASVKAVGEDFLLEGVPECSPAL